MREARYQNLWDLIVNNDDISFKHIISRLDSNDLKFLYGVNTETRKLIKRSSRAIELKKRFDVKKMSSISTLEFAWEHFPWGGTYNSVEEEFRSPRDFVDIDFGSSVGALSVGHVERNIFLLESCSNE